MATQNSINIGIVAGSGLTYTFPSVSDTLIGQLTIDQYHKLVASVNTTISANYNVTVSDSYEVADGYSLTINDTGILQVD